MYTPFCGEDISFIKMEIINFLYFRVMFQNAFKKTFLRLKIYINKNVHLLKPKV